PVCVVLDVSAAVTVMLNVFGPAVGKLAGAPVTMKCVVEGAPTLPTLTLELVPVIDAVAESAAVSVWKPADLKVTSKVPVSFVSGTLAGGVVAGSLLDTLPVPPLWVVSAVAAAGAVTLKVFGLPAGEVVGVVVTEKCVVAPGIVVGGVRV